MSTRLPLTHGLRFLESGFYVVHRRHEFGLFDYEWGTDLRCVELTYRGSKYGEFWSIHEMCLDLREFRLPRRVVQVSVLVTGCLLLSLTLGESVQERQSRTARTLRQFGCARFAESLDRSRL